MELLTVVAICILQAISLHASEESDSDTEWPKLDMRLYQAEVNAGSMADLMENKHVYHTHKFKLNDLNRRFLPEQPRRFLLEQPYKEVLPAMEDEDAVGNFHENIQMSRKAVDGGEDPKLIPMKASPELVLAVAKESAKMPVVNLDDDERVKILRSGDYWNGFWKEDVDTKAPLRTNDVEEKEPTRESIKAKIMPGSNLYHLVSVLQRMSPKLLYIINKPN